MSRLLDQVAEVLAAFKSLKTQPALIGGLALAAHQVVRATKDVDFLVDAEDAERIDQLLVSMGYRCVHRSLDAANYVRGDQALDLIYAHRPIARRLLAGALTRQTPVGRLRVIGAEGLIGFKLQALVNDPSRPNDLQDIIALLRYNSGSLDLNQVREYFALFDREGLLDELLADISE